MSLVKGAAVNPDAYACTNIQVFLPLFPERQYLDCAISMANENKYSNIIPYVHQAVTTQLRLLSNFIQTGPAIKIIHIKSQASAALPIYTSNLSHLKLLRKSEKGAKASKKVVRPPLFSNILHSTVQDSLTQCIKLPARVFSGECSHKNGKEEQKRRHETNRNLWKGRETGRGGRRRRRNPTAGSHSNTEQKA